MAPRPYCLKCGSSAVNLGVEMGVPSLSCMICGNIAYKGVGLAVFEMREEKTTIVKEETISPQKSDTHPSGSNPHHVDFNALNIIYANRVRREVNTTARHNPVLTLVANRRSLSSQNEILDK
jgi:hypothetical protein